MSDPAVKAAEIATSSGEIDGLTPLGIALRSARTALQPIRDRHRPFTRDYPGGDGRTVCNHCLGPRDWPCPDALDAYTSEELQR